MPRRGASAGGEFRLPVLMYHSISDDPEAGRSAYYKVCTSPRRFAEQMRWLADWGYRGVTLTQGLEALRGRAAGSDGAGARPVAITFDDGFRDFRTAALPILQQHGFSATMYLPTAFIGEDRSASGRADRRSFNSRECLTWPEVRLLEAAGIEFGSHTVSHPRLIELDWPVIEAELRDSKAILEHNLGHPVRSFAYPYGYPSTNRAFTARFKQTLRTLGYETCVTTEIGLVRPADEPLELKRLPANSADDAALLGAKLAGAYDWLHWPQSIVKRLKSLG